LARRIFTLATALLAVAVSTPNPLPAGPKQLGSSPLTVHEWGTFTSIAGADGHAVEWLPPLTSDLPSFVERYRGAYVKASLAGTIRMETPVIYFYASNETSVSVRVSFSKGLITEWYPRADSVSPADPPRHQQSSWPDPPPHRHSSWQPPVDGGFTWSWVSVSPNLSSVFEKKTWASHYYAARQTSATPLAVKTPSADQHEKFLFYRGVSRASIPL